MQPDPIVTLDRAFTKTMPRPQFVYVIQLGTLYKIGRSLNPKKRIANMQLPAKPSDESFQWRTFDYVKLERELHEMFNHKRVNGEWFRLDQDDLSRLNEHCFEQFMNDFG